MDKTFNRWLLLLVPVVVASGLLLGLWQIRQRDRELRDDLLAQARRVARGISVLSIQSLSGTEADLTSPLYERLKQRLSVIRRSCERDRFVYLLGRKPDGTVFLMVDSEPAESPDYSPPGQVYSEAGQVEAKVFQTGVPVAYGPTPDRWGTWFTAYVPIARRASDKIVAVLGIDVDARRWRRDLALAAVPSGLVTAALSALLLAGWFLLARRERLGAAAPAWMWQLEPAVTAAFGLVLAVFVGWTTRQHDERHLRRVFAELADSEIDAAAGVIEDLRTFELESLARFLESSADVGWEEFQQFAEYLAQNPAVHAWEWIPVVTAADRRRFEEQVRAAGRPDFQIWQLGASGERVSAAARDVCYPVTFVNPLESNRVALGFDCGSEARRLAAFQEAIRTGLPTCTDPITLVQETGRQQAMMVIRPVFHAGEPGRPRGFAVALLRLDDLVRSLRAASSVHLELALLTAEGKSVSLASSCDVGRNVRPEFTVSQPLGAFGKVFSLNARPSEEFFRHRPRQTWVWTSLAALLATATLTFLVSEPVRRRERLERLLAAETAALRESEARYEHVARQSRTYTWEVNREGLITYISPTVESVLGYRPEELVGCKYILDLCPEAEREEQRQLLAGVLERKESLHDFENPVTARDGRVLTVCSSAFPLFDAAGQVIGYRGADQDVTERRKAQQDYRMLFHEMLDGFALHEIICDAQGQPVDFRYLAVNPAFERLLGRRAEEVLGKTVLEILPGTEAYWIETYGRVALTGEPVHFEEYSSELDKFFSIAAFRPAPSQFACIARDVSGHKRSAAERERLLAESERARQALLSVIEDLRRTEAERARLAEAIEQSAETVVITDQAGTIVYVNPTFTAVSGYSRQEAVGRNPRLLKSGVQDESFYRTLWDTISSGRTWRGRMFNRRKDGTCFTEEATISPVRDAAGRITHYVAVKRDVTEHLRQHEDRLQLEQQLQQAQRVESIGRLAGGVAHDFNNLLSVILGYGEQLIEDLASDVRLREKAEKLVESARRSAALTRQLLAFSRRQTLQPKVLDLNRVLRDLDSMLRRLIGEDVELELVLASALSRVLADPGQIEQAVMNLAVNARDAMPHGGTLLIETADVELDEVYAQTHVDVLPGRYVLVAVSDTGCGIPREHLPKIFEPFFTTKEPGRGTGLGLATVYGIVKQSGGHIWVYSEPGRGATFKIYLPVTLAEQEPEASPAAAAKPPRGSEHILVVEDEASLRSLVERELRSLGYWVTTAVEGEAALRLVNERGLQPDLLLTDVIMPKMGGAVLAEHLRRIRPDLKVLYMSGYTDSAIMHHGVLDPDKHFIEKPFQIRDLAIKLRQILGGPTPPRPARILIVDDDATVRDLVRCACAKRGHHVSGAGTTAAALEALAAGGIDVLLVDVNLPGTDGESVLRQLRAAACTAPAIVLTGDAFSVDTASLESLGVIDVQEKTGDYQPLVERIEEILAGRQ